jgi:hypothetical protein
MHRAIASAGSGGRSPLRPDLTVDPTAPLGVRFARLNRGDIGRCGADDPANDGATIERFAGKCRRGRRRTVPCSSTTAVSAPSATTLPP